MNIASFFSINYCKKQQPLLRNFKLNLKLIFDIGIFVSLKIETTCNSRLNTDGPLEPAMNFTQRPSILPVTLTGHGTASCRYNPAGIQQSWQLYLCAMPVECIPRQTGIGWLPRLHGPRERESKTSTKWSARNPPPSLGSRDWQLLATFLQLTLFFPPKFRVCIRWKRCCCHKFKIRCGIWTQGLGTAVLSVIIRGFPPPLKRTLKQINRIFCSLM